jgi:anthranilate synthase component I
MPTILNQTFRKLHADTYTPVSIYLKIRDKFAHSILLESSDYHAKHNRFSYICCQPIAFFKVEGNKLSSQLPNESIKTVELAQKSLVISELEKFTASFEVQFETQFETQNANTFPFITNGLFGYSSYDAVQYFEQISFDSSKNQENQIPEIFYQVFRFIMVIDHFKEELYVFDNQGDKNENEENGLQSVIALIENKNFASYQFALTTDESSNYTDNEFLQIIDKGKQHCYRGDVFQLVLARRFQRNFSGDEFNVYRALRSINPSPYLFYFDFGSFKIFGSSPEAQLTVKDGQAAIYPIAGTFRRTGNDLQDAQLAEKLLNDPKESAEHVMLVDLARNDLSRHGEKVHVETFKEVQYYSHVIHLVSKVTAQVETTSSTIRMAADTFPAGTLSGAPKYKAMQLIDSYEVTPRSYYGGAIGFLGFNGEFNHAIMIRSFLSKSNTLFYQAGAGVVAKSDTASELQEVNNKLAALRRALNLATDFGKK